MRLGSILTAPTSPCLFIIHIRFEQLGLFIFILFCSAFAGDFLTYLVAIFCLFENTTQRLQHKDISDWMQREGGRGICCIMGDQSTRKLILHQVSSIFLGSGSLGKHSLDTRKTVCTARLPGELCGKKRRRSRPASHLQREKTSHMYHWISTVRIYIYFRRTDLSSCTTKTKHQRDPL